MNEQIVNQPEPIIPQPPTQNKPQPLHEDLVKEVQNLKKVVYSLAHQESIKFNQQTNIIPPQLKDNPQSEFLQSKMKAKGKDTKPTQDIYKNFKRDWKIRIANKQRNIPQLKRQNQEQSILDESKQKQEEKSNNLDESIINKHLSFLNSRAETDQQQPPKTQFFAPDIKSSSANQLNFKKTNLISAIQNEHNQFRSYINKQRKSIFTNRGEKFEPNRESVSRNAKKSVNITTQVQGKKKYSESRQLKMLQDVKQIIIGKQAGKEQLIEKGKKLLKILYPPFQQQTVFTIKKYKNCIVFSLMPNITKAVIYHYPQDIYFGNVSLEENSKIEKNGQGIEIVKQRHFYQGYFINGKKNGRGKIIYENGDIYDGQWNEGQIYGYGKYHDHKKDANYEGFWKKGQFCGQKNSSNEHNFQF